MAWEFERVAGPFSFTEGPVWTGEALLFTDIRNSRIMRYDPTTRVCAPFATETNEANGLTLDRQGRLYVAEGGGRRVARYDADGTRVTLADRFESVPLNSPNDLVVDDQGRVWFTDPCYGDRTSMVLSHDSVYRLDPQSDGTWSLTRVTFDTTRPNGLAFAPDYRTLYVAESPPLAERPAPIAGLSGSFRWHAGPAPSAPRFRPAPWDRRHARGRRGVHRGQLRLVDQRAWPANRHLFSRGAGSREPPHPDESNQLQFRRLRPAEHLRNRLRWLSLPRAHQSAGSAATVSRSARWNIDCLAGPA